MGKKLYVGNLPYSATDQILVDTFSQCGTVESAKIIMDRDTGVPVLSLPPQPGGLYAIAFHPSGKLLATAGGNRRINFWELPSGRLQRTLEGHTELIYGIDFHPDGTRLASASTDQTVRIWHVPTGDSLLSVPYSSQVYGVEFTPDGSRLATLPMNGTIRFLNAPEAGKQ